MKHRYDLEYVETLVCFNGMSFVELYRDQESGQLIIDQWIDVVKQVDVHVQFVVSEMDLVEFKSRTKSMKYLWEQATEFWVSKDETKVLDVTARENLLEFQPTDESLFDPMFAYSSPGKKDFLH